MFCWVYNIERTAAAARHGTVHKKTRLVIGPISPNPKRPHPILLLFTILSFPSRFPTFWMMDESQSFSALTFLRDDKRENPPSNRRRKGKKISRQTSRQVQIKAAHKKSSAEAFVFSPFVYTRRLGFLNERESFAAEKKSRSFFSF